MPGGSAEPVSQLRGGPGQRQLEECERVPASFADDAVSDSVVHRSSDNRVEQSPGVCVIEPLEGELVESGPITSLRGLAYCEDHHHRLRDEAACDEDERLC